MDPCTTDVETGWLRSRAQALLPDVARPASHDGLGSAIPTDPGNRAVVARVMPPADAAPICSGSRAPAHPERPATRGRSSLRHHRRGRHDHHRGAPAARSPSAAHAFAPGCSSTATVSAGGRAPARDDAVPSLLPVTWTCLGMSMPARPPASRHRPAHARARPDQTRPDEPQRMIRQ